MSHPCACCSLRFASTGELADHVREEHHEHPPFHEEQATVVRQRWSGRASTTPPARAGRHAAR